MLLTDVKLLGLNVIFISSPSGSCLQKSGLDELWRTGTSSQSAFTSPVELQRIFLIVDSMLELVNFLF